MDMYHKIIRNLTLIILASMAGVSGLYLTRPNYLKQKNGFSRNITPRKIKLLAQVANDHSLTGICGMVNDSICFSRRTADSLFFYSPDLRLLSVSASGFETSRILHSRFNIYTDNINTLLFAGNVPAIYLYHKETKRTSRYSLPAVFNRAVAMQENQILLRIIADTLGKFDQVFAKLNLSTNELRYEDGISELRGDLGFSTDGLLHYDERNGLAAFVAFYSNRILCIDSNLKAVKNFRTIDTISQNTTVYSSMERGRLKGFSNTSPKLLVNRESTVSDGLLWVCSELKADNEDLEIFRKHSVIDVYRIRDGLYLESFYVPNYRNKKLLRFCIFGDKLVVLYKKQLAVYQLL